jgi:deazaflavin-dependent oxidoreductase (nitroreductase family)
VSLAGTRPGRVLRWLFRVPLYLQNMGIGGWERLLGINFIRITTKGRRTGRSHSVLVDVLQYDRVNDVYYVQSAYGERADWVRNIEAHPVFDVQVGRRRFKATAERVTGPRGAEILEEYIMNHRWYSRTMMRSIGVDLDAFTEEELRAKLEDEMVLMIKLSM